MSFYNWLFTLLYPHPRRGEDLLAHKQKFIEEYISPILFGPMEEETDPFDMLTKNIPSIKKQKDKEQKKRLIAQKTWQKMLFRKKILSFKKRRNAISSAKQMIEKINEKADYIQKETERERSYRERYSKSEYSSLYGPKELRDWEEKKRFLAHKRWHNLQKQR